VTDSYLIGLLQRSLRLRKGAMHSRGKQGASKKARTGPSPPPQQMKRGERPKGGGGWSSQPMKEKEEGRDARHWAKYSQMKRRRSLVAVAFTRPHRRDVGSELYSADSE
jgi:hypothetical protein